MKWNEKNKQKEEVSENNHNEKHPFVFAELMMTEFL